MRDFIDGKGGEWDFDDFESNKIADPRLESIRERVAQVPLPVTDDSLVELRALLAEVENLVSQAI